MHVCFMFNSFVLIEKVLNTFIQKYLYLFRELICKHHVNKIISRHEFIISENSFVKYM